MIPQGMHPLKGWPHLCWPCFPFPFKKLGADLAPSSILLRQHNTHDNEKATQVLGSFNQYNHIEHKVKRHIGKIVKSLILEKLYGILPLTITSFAIKVSTSVIMVCNSLNLVGVDAILSWTTLGQCVLVWFFLSTLVKKGDDSPQWSTISCTTFGYGEKLHLRQRLDVCRQWWVCGDP